MRESGGKRKEAGTAEKFPPKKNFIYGEDPFTVLVWGFYIGRRNSQQGEQW